MEFVCFSDFGVYYIEDGKILMSGFELFYVLGSRRKRISIELVFVIFDFWCFLLNCILFYFYRNFRVVIIFNIDEAIELER